MARYSLLRVSRVGAASIVVLRAGIDTQIKILLIVNDIALFDLLCLNGIMKDMQIMFMETI